MGDSSDVSWVNVASQLLWATNAGEPPITHQGGGLTQDAAKGALLLVEAAQPVHGALHTLPQGARVQESPVGGGKGEDAAHFKAQPQLHHPDKDTKRGWAARGLDKCFSKRLKVCSPTVDRLPWPSSSPGITGSAPCPNMAKVEASNRLGSPKSMSAQKGLGSCPPTSP